MRKHRLAELLLTEVIGLPWHKAHLEAGRWEHVISDEVEERLIVLLGNPLTCPHGNPIPGAGAPRRDLTMLEDAETGQRCAWSGSPRRLSWTPRSSTSANTDASRAARRRSAGPCAPDGHS